MGLNLNEWVDLGDGRVALVTGWDEASGMAVAELPSGEQVDRQISFAESRWRPVRQEGLRVAAALDLAATRIRAEEAPVEILIAALNDLGGRAETKDIRALITTTILPDDEWERWWRRTQVKLEDDERIDTRRSRDKVYAVADAMSALGRGLVPPLQEETRRGRRMADGPQLKRARDRAQRKGPVEPDDEPLFAAELSIATNADADPTDRFMAAEIGIWRERWDESKLVGLLQDDLLRVDLARIPAHESRTRALDLALGQEGAGESITARSAMAVGPPWSDRVLAYFVESPASLRSIAFGVLGWAVPGDEDAGPAKLKEDIPTYERRVERAESMRPTLPADARLGLWDGGYHALLQLPHSATYATPLDRVRQRIARLIWSIYDGLDLHMRQPLRGLPVMDREAFAPFVRAAPKEAHREIKAAVLDWYARDPIGQIPNLRLAAETMREDLLALGLEAAQSIARNTPLPKIALQLFQEVTTEKRRDARASEVVNLAVTTASEDPNLNSALDRLAESIVEGYFSGAEPVPGPITFSRSGWERFSRLVADRLEDAAASEQKARREAQTATSEATRLRELAEERAKTLAESRSNAGSAAQQDVQRLASNLLRPVATAVGDSYESQSLEALQDRLLAVLQRARIVPVLEPGDSADFDPSRHMWVGEGPPTQRVEARSPGFLVEDNGGDEIVLVPARVVAATGR